MHLRYEPFVVRDSSGTLLLMPWLPLRPIRVMSAKAGLDLTVTYYNMQEQLNVQAQGSLAK
jgi:hypothetical protein